MTQPRTLASLWAAKGTAFASRALGRGGGTAASGLIGSWLQPSLIKELAGQLDHGSIIVTGTNGKTTTSLILSDTVRAAGLKPLANASGSNLVRGLASTLALATGPNGRIRNAGERVGVFEVDEATVPRVLEDLKPRAVVFTQLDRYGEVAAVAALWRRMLQDAPDDLHLVLNADDPAVASLGEARGQVTYFGVADASLDQGEPDHASDALNCVVCGTRLEYSVAFYGHVGHWCCPGCNRARPEPSVIARKVSLEDGRSCRFDLATADHTAAVSMGLGGLYNIYNALAAVAGASALGLPIEAGVTAIEGAAAAFGRQEAFDVDGRRVEVFLGKNPAGLNQVLSTLLLDPARKTALFVLNDGIADGRDISWIWDADFEVAAGKLERVITSGTRAAEMALRLKYAEWDEKTLEVDPQIGRALDRAIEQTRPGDCLTIVPTYTAMLVVRELLAKRAGKEPFWRS